MLPVIALGHRGRTGVGAFDAEVSNLGEQAVLALRRAAAAGFRDLGFMRRDTDLDPLRGRADFQMLLLDVGFPKNPFGR